MIFTKIYLKSRRKPIMLLFESEKTMSKMLFDLNEKKFISVGQFCIASDDVSSIEFISKE